ncbi:D-2-hydroxyglutarate dehydrogenase, mitochondrial-like isoform X2 [Bacillus rossius redtenbacheri]|uniref:D-2-hydroxyglutarate dehydrogenase, mitochondrial-like isoform X2 n=1 Tax=Bacillus rossius redtenbacheri TaxID=93214 RepID=UPI002FDDFE65
MLRLVFARAWRHGRGQAKLLRSVVARQRRELSSAVQLTAERYPDVKRGNYSVLADRHLQFFESILGRERVLTDPDDVEPYNVDWLRMVRGASKVVLKPKTTEEVSAILKFCNAESLAVCPQGGNTGLVGGSVPVFDEVVVSTSLMNNIISLDELSGVLVCQAGCVLETLEGYVQERGLMMPLDLGAKGSCQIGGNVSTNAGGLRLLRYGSLHGSVLGIEAVKADGQVLDCLSSLKKDNTGYHLKHLFIGSEGTLGLVTKVAIQCPASPRAVNTAFLGLLTFEDVLQTFKDARSGLGEILSSCEMMDAASMDASVGNLKLTNPISDHPFYMLIETSGSNGQHDEEKLTQFLERSMERGTVRDGTVATEPSRIKRMWELRETITPGLLGDGYVYKYDISLPHDNFYSIVPEMKKHLEGRIIRCCGYGHIGDGNLHLNITSREFDHNILDMIEPYVFEWTSKLRGSISAEHGIGFKKTKFIHYTKSQSSIDLMKQLKSMMDPKGILNPYKSLWESRERIADALSADGFLYTYDLTIPHSCFYEPVVKAKHHLESCSKVVRVCGFGHLGDNNLHLNVTSKQHERAVEELMEPAVFEWTAALRGSISAEHGLGFKKNKFIRYSKSRAAVDLMRDLKLMMDPKLILNPYKVLVM